jgi:hypothetical protein
MAGGLERTRQSGSHVTFGSSDPALTIGFYAKTSLHDMQGAATRLRDPTGKAPNSEVLAATGTDKARPLVGSATHSATDNAEMVASNERKVVSFNGLRDADRGGFSARDRRFDLW